MEQIKLQNLELLLVAGEVGGFDVEPILAGKAQHVFAVDVPRHAVGVRLLQDFQQHILLLKPFPQDYHQLHETNIKYQGFF